MPFPEVSFEVIDPDKAAVLGHLDYWVGPPLNYFVFSVVSSSSCVRMGVYLAPGRTLMGQSSRDWSPS